MLLTILTGVATTATVLIARGPAPQVVPLVAAASYLVSILVIRAEVATAMRGAPTPSTTTTAPAHA